MSASAPVLVSWMVAAAVLTAAMPAVGADAVASTAAGSAEAGSVATGSVASDEAAPSAGPGALRMVAPDEASWEPLVPGQRKGPTAAVVSAPASGMPTQVLLRVPKEGVLPAGRHAAAATLVLLEGELSIEASGRTFQLKRRGAVLEIPAGTVYRGKSPWDQAALVLVTLSGVWERSLVP